MAIEAALTPAPRQASIFDRVGVRYVKITRRTGPPEAVGQTRTMPSLSAANAILLGWAARVPKAAQDFVNYELCWCDGRIFKGHIELRNATVSVPNLMVHVSSELKLLAGVAQHERLDPDDFNSIVADYDLEVRLWARDLIERYEIFR